MVLNETKNVVYSMGDVITPFQNHFDTMIGWMLVCLFIMVFFIVMMGFITLIRGH